MTNLNSAKDRLLESLSNLETRINEKIEKIESDFKKELSMNNSAKNDIEQKYKTLELNYASLKSLSKETIKELNHSINAIEKILNVKNENS